MRSVGLGMTLASAPARDLRADRRAYILGMDTYFNHPTALKLPEPVLSAGDGRAPGRAGVNVIGRDRGRARMVVGGLLPESSVTAPPRQTLG